jgi:hypothetical protein
MQIVKRKTLYMFRGVKCYGREKSRVGESSFSLSLSLSLSLSVCVCVCVCERLCMEDTKLADQVRVCFTEVTCKQRFERGREVSCGRIAFQVGRTVDSKTQGQVLS